MTPEDVKKIRDAFSEIVGKEISAHQMAAVLELSPDNDARTYRRYESEGPSGPAVVALRYMAQGLAGLYPDLGIPQFVCGRGIHTPLSGPSDKFIVRLWWPRFVATIVMRSTGGDGVDEVDDFVIDDQRSLRVVQWIDDPLTFSRARRYYGEHAASHVRRLSGGQ